MELFRVSSNTKSRKLARAIHQTLLRDGSMEIRAIGERAVNTTVAAMTMANFQLQGANKYLVSTPYFEKIEQDGKPTTTLKFVVGAYED